MQAPIFVVAPPRSGGALLASALARAPGIALVSGDLVAEQLPDLEPSGRAGQGSRLTAAEADPESARRIAAAAEDLAGQGEQARRLLFATPRNALRIPFINAAFPEARFVYVYRDPDTSIAAMTNAWESGASVSHPDLPEWQGPAWSGPLIPGWQELRGKELPEIVARQWATITEILLADLEDLAPEQWAVTDHSALIRDPSRHIGRICEFLGVEAGDGVTSVLRMVGHELETANRRLRQGHSPGLGVLGEEAQSLDRQAREMLAEDPDQHRPASPDSSSPLRSVHTGSIPQMLKQIGASLLVSTYQTGKLICLRADGNKLNTHFRNFNKPMGIAVHDGRFAMGGLEEIWDFRNMPAAAPKVEPKGKHDACYLPRNRHLTGDIAIHEMEFAGGELWFVATAFSCLATLDAGHSFVPRWKPPFIEAITPGDRCHLNGMCVIDDQVRYVTALGTTDEPGGWRENKAHGGVLIDVESAETVLEGLSMPHSPRWHRGRLWVLESGEGSICVADLEAGTWETVAQLPGFTRGLAFAGNLAFVGLSQVRETSTFGGLPLTERLDERLCGVWVVDIDRGEVVGFLRFEEQVQEVFEVAFLPGSRYPEIAEPGSSATQRSFELP